MKRAIADRSILDKFCTDFCSVVDRHAKYIIVSGFLAIASGRTRGTEDIDIIVEKLNKQKFIGMHNDLVKRGFICMQSDNPEEIYDNYLSQKASVRYTYKNEPIPEMELKLAKDELDLYQIKTRVKIPLTGLEVWFSSINMNVAFKEEYLKSDKDMEDARHLRIVYAEQISEDKIKSIKQMIKKLRL